MLKRGNVRLSHSKNKILLYTVFSLIITRPSYFFRVSVIGVFIGDVSVIETVFHIISTLLNSTVKLSSMAMIYEHFELF